MTPFHDKKTEQLAMKGNFLSVIKSTYEKLTANIIIFSDERLKTRMSTLAIYICMYVCMYVHTYICVRV